MDQIPNMENVTIKTRIFVLQVDRVQEAGPDSLADTGADMVVDMVADMVDRAMAEDQALVEGKTMAVD